MRSARGGHSAGVARAIVSCRAPAVLLQHALAEVRSHGSAGLAASFQGPTHALPPTCRCCKASRSPAASSHASRSSIPRSIFSTLPGRRRAGRRRMKQAASAADQLVAACAACVRAWLPSLRRQSQLSLGSAQPGGKCARGAHRPAASQSVAWPTTHASTHVQQLHPSCSCGNEGPAQDGLQTRGGDHLTRRLDHSRSSSSSSPSLPASLSTRSSASCISSSLPLPASRGPRRLGC